MLRVAVDANRLNDIPALEEALGGKFLQAELLEGGKAEVSLLPVASLDFFVNVWNCQAQLYLAYGGACELAEEVLDLDAEAVQELIDLVVYDDNGGAINMSGLYYPTSDESAAAFLRVMETAKAENANGGDETMTAQDRAREALRNYYPATDTVIQEAADQEEAQAIVREALDKLEPADLFALAVVADSLAG